MKGFKSMYRMAAILLITIGGFWSSWIIQNWTSQAVDHTHVVLGRVESVAEAITAAETAQRGYLLTEDTSYLRPFYNSQKRLPYLISDLDNLTKDNKRQKPRIAKLLNLVNAKLKELDQTVNLMRQGRNEDAIQIVFTHKGYDLMDQIQATLSLIRSDENNLLNRREYFLSLVKTGIPWLLMIFTSALILLVFLKDKYYILDQPNSKSTAKDC